jgi:hypothetical protein
MNRLTKSAAGLILAVSAFSFSSCDDGDSNVMGLNSFAKYGSIKVTVEGEDPENQDFKETKNFKFTSSGTPTGSSSVFTYDDDGFYRYFVVDRYISPFDDGDDSAVNFELQMDDEDEPTFNYGSFDLETSVITEGNKFFYLDESFDLEEEDITSYDYNAETGKLNVKFTKELEDSSTGNPLTVTVDVSVKVFEDIGSQPGF